MRKALPNFIRFIVGLFLIWSSYPPTTLGVYNIFVFLPALAGLAVIAWPLLRLLLQKLLGPKYRPLVGAGAIVLTAVLALMSVGFLVIFTHSFSRSAPPADSVVIVPGSKAVNGVPTILLMGRIDVAGEYLRAHPSAFCIACGGQGSDESEPEAVTIKKWLVKRWGIDGARILTDSTSRNTAANFSNAAAIIRQKGLSTDIAAATDGFHEFRCGVIAKRRGLVPYPLPVKTDARLQVFLYLREILALPKSLLFD